jgi:F-type H+-transporting ATPase subunit b
LLRRENAPRNDKNERFLSEIATLRWKVSMIEFNFTLFMTWINFLILFLVLRQFLFLPILQIQAWRKKQKQDSQDQVVEYKKQFDALEKQYHERSEQVREEMNGLIQQARNSALSHRKERRAQAEKEITLQIEQTRALVEKETLLARSTLSERASGLASQIVTKIRNGSVPISVVRELSGSSIP